MANRSDWKGFEKLVAKALGGKRRLRTMESYGKEATDVYFPKDVRKIYPFLKKVKVECKKRKTINVHNFYQEAKIKYGREKEIVILASKIPAGSGSKSWRSLRKKFKKKYKVKLKRKDFCAALVTVELGFFEDLWNAWLLVHRKRKDDGRE